MPDVWRWIVSFLVWLSADPGAITAESPKAAAAVAVAYSALAEEPVPDAPPKPVGPVTSGTKCPGGVCPVPRTNVLR